MESKENGRGMGMYIHIPFCVQKCVYCDFLSAPASRQIQHQYIEALKQEIFKESKQYINRTIKTIFFGGGTPSLLEAEEIEALLNCIREQYCLDSAAEITLELNPKTASYKKLQKLRKAGVNRLSIGVQSANNEELQRLGRIHSYEDFLQTYTWARAAGFDNINIDLMCALPGQTLISWRQTLQQVLALRPEHISAYSLIIEEGTHLYDKLEEYPSVPDEDIDRQMYQETKSLLAACGFCRYEISNYARAGYACKHNEIYWQRGIRHISDFVGFGLGASSTVECKRWSNTEDMRTYLEEYPAIKTQVQQLSQRDQMEEFMFLGLRMMCGVSKQEFLESFGISMDVIYGGILQKWIARGMLMQQGDYILLTDAGIDVSNVVFADFLL